MGTSNSNMVTSDNSAPMHPLQSVVRRCLDQQPWWRLLFFVTAAFAMYLATMKGPYPVPSAPNDKVNHFIAFLAMTGMLRLGFPGWRPRLCGLLMLAYGGLIEVVQSFLPWADSSIFDVIADGVGILAALGLLVVIAKAGWWRPPHDSDPPR